MKNHLTHLQAELGLSRMWPKPGSNPHPTQRYDRVINSALNRSAMGAASKNSVLCQVNKDNVKHTPLFLTYSLNQSSLCGLLSTAL